ncbi:MAG: hypothetical protein WBO95_08735 [Candidatus Dechloromonas phosphoritropha]
MPVHIDPEDDHDPDVAAARLPSREVVRDDLTGLLADLPRPDRVVLHYLDEQIKGHPVICSISLNFRIAPWWCNRSHACTVMVRQILG